MNYSQRNSGFEGKKSNNFQKNMLTKNQKLSTKITNNEKSGLDSGNHFSNKGIIYINSFL